jgi:LmbE family N-acetylglucosaminyl deacetylase
MKIAVIGAHPDDEVLGCGASIPLWVRQGHEVYIALLGEGITARFQERTTQVEEAIKGLREDAKRVCDFIGATEIFMEGLPDNRFDTLPLLDLVKRLERIIQSVQPQVIYTHHGGDLNIDHSVLNRAVLTATRPIVTSSVKELYTFEVPSSTEWSFQRNSGFKPNVFQNVTETISAKLAAMEMYRSEAREFPHPRSPEALHVRAKNWGTVAGCAAAEAFELIRSIR